MAHSEAQQLWRKHLDLVAGAARRWRRAQVASALLRYDRGRDLTALLPGLRGVSGNTSKALRAELRRQLKLKARGAASLKAERIALLYAALIVERRFRLIGSGGTRPPH
jgi:hypothetical protein